jgi:DnaJ domain
MEYTDKILKVAETIVAGMKSLQKPANLPRAQDNAMAAKRVRADSRGITPNIGVNKDFPFGPPLPTPATGRPNLFEPPPVTPVRVPAAAAPAPAAAAPAAAAPAAAAPAPAAAAPAGPPGALAPAPPQLPPAPPVPPAPSAQPVQKKRTYYEILGVSRNASEDDIKKAVREKTLAFHPNKHMSKSPEDRTKVTEEMKFINEAGTILRDPNSRAKYNKSLGIKKGGRRNRLTVSRRLNKKRRSTYRR